MKKFLLTILSILFFSVITFGQARVGYSETQIKNEFKNKKIQEGYLSDPPIKYLFWSDATMTVMYYLANSEFCLFCRIYPKANYIINKLIEIYNNNYVKISDTEWRMYTDERVVKIELLYSKDKGTYFSFSALPKE